MSAWNERIAAAAKTLDLSVETMKKFLVKHGIDETTALPPAQADFEGVLKAEPEMSTRSWSPFVLKKAWANLCTDAAKPIPPGPATPAKHLLQLLAHEASPETRQQVMRVLSEKIIHPGKPATWADADFIVLKKQPGGLIDVTATQQVMDALEQGSQQIQSRSRVFVVADGTRHVVHRMQDIRVDGPTALRVRDPLDPAAFLDPVTKVSKKYNIRVALADDRHQLLLFAMIENLKAAPRDESEAEALLAQVHAAATTDAAAKSLGETVLVRWQAAQYADPASAAALPAIRVPAAIEYVGPHANAPQAASLQLPLSNLPQDLLLPVIQAAKADQIRAAILNVGGDPRGTTKLDLARQFIALNPPILALVEHIVNDPFESMICEPVFEKLTGESYLEWRTQAVVAKVAAVVASLNSSKAASPSVG